jgi:hypothetical protein
MKNYYKQAEEIISDCLKFVYKGDDERDLALLISHVKYKHKEEIQYIAQGLEHSVPAFVFMSIFTEALFKIRMSDYEDKVDENPEIEN